LHEQRSIQVRDPSELPHARLPDIPAPSTVSQPQAELPAWQIPLDEAIRVALGNANVVRVLGGVTASSSGQTIYDTAIVNTDIDEVRARFDPAVRVNNTWSGADRPARPRDPQQTEIFGQQSDDYDLDVGVSKQTIIGGELGLGVKANTTRLEPNALPLDPLNPSTGSSAEFSYKQPLLQGGGWAANVAPLVIARIDTERSYFQFKDSVQEHVRGVIEAYWSLVFARTDVWARKRQLEQAAYALRLAEGRQRFGIVDVGDVSQARVAQARFRANLIAAEANLHESEAVLRNMLGLPPADGQRLVPVSPPSKERFEPDWQGLVALAEERRPDLVELKLIIEADQQRLLQSKNQALPSVEAVALYRWNGLEGEMPNGDRLRSAPGQFTDWGLGVNFSVPLGLRQSRADLRRKELLIARDRANLDQGVHNAVHLLAVSVRDLAQFYEQYQAYRELRDAARKNLEYQLGRFGTGQILFLNVLLAINDWGDAISNEARALTRYNVEQATLERLTGTILETHGVTFYEERYGSLGPLGRWCQDVCYPSDLPPTPNADRYPTSDQPAENAFDLQQPEYRRRKPAAERSEEIPAPRGPPRRSVPGAAG
jgi:outer membrane protein TolC